MQIIIVFFHLPWQYTRTVVTEVQIVFKLIDYIVDNICLLPAVQVVGLATLTQKYFGTIIDFAMLIVSKSKLR